MPTRVGLGMRSHLVFGEESVYGTPVSRPYAIEIVNESLQLQVARIETQALVRRGVHSNRVALGAKTVQGNVEFEATYGGWLKLAKHAFGQIDTTTPDPTNAPTAKQHKFTIANTLPTGLTFGIFRDSDAFVTDSGQEFIYEGIKISSMEFSCGVEELLRINMSVIGEDENKGAKSTPSYTSEELAVYHQGSLIWGSTELEIEAFTITLNNNLAYRPKIGSQLTREPQFDQKVEVTGSFTVEFDTWAQYNDFKNSTFRIIDITFVGDNIEGSINRQIRFLCNVADIVDARVALGSPGRIKLEIDFKAYRTDLANELELYVRNTDTGI